MCQIDVLGQRGIAVRLGVGGTRRPAPDDTDVAVRLGCVASETLQRPAYRPLRLLPMPIDSLTVLQFRWAVGKTWRHAWNPVLNAMAYRHRRIMPCLVMATAGADIK
ncbi:hypothetical protein A4G31_09995 [Mycobacterium persicum]|nr:hypothetical protein A4G31_09995 [Mycobacterium persicum]